MPVIICADCCGLCCLFDGHGECRGVGAFAFLTLDASHVASSVSSGKSQPTCRLHRRSFFLIQDSTCSALNFNSTAVFSVNCRFFNRWFYLNLWHFKSTIADHTKFVWPRIEEKVYEKVVPAAGYRHLLVGELSVMELLINRQHSSTSKIYSGYLFLPVPPPDTSASS